MKIMNLERRYGGMAIYELLANGLSSDQAPQAPGSCQSLEDFKRRKLDGFLEFSTLSKTPHLSFH